MNNDYNFNGLEKDMGFGHMDPLTGNWVYSSPTCEKRVVELKKFDGNMPWAGASLWEGKTGEYVARLGGGWNVIYEDSYKIGDEIFGPDKIVRVGVCLGTGSSAYFYDKIG